MYVLFLGLENNSLEKQRHVIDLEKKNPSKNQILTYCR